MGVLLVDSQINSGQIMPLCCILSSVLGLSVVCPFLMRWFVEITVDLAEWLIFEFSIDDSPPSANSSAPILGCPDICAACAPLMMRRLHLSTSLCNVAVSQIHECLCQHVEDQLNVTIVR